VGEPDNLLRGFLVARVVTVHGRNIRFLRPCFVQHIEGWKQTLVLVELSLRMKMAQISAEDVEAGTFTSSLAYCFELRFSIWDGFDDNQHVVASEQLSDTHLSPAK